MPKSIQEVAIAALARREHSQQEMRFKLKHKGFAADDIEAALSQLIADNLLSEERFTESYINMRRRRGYGPVRIRQELRERGVADELIEDYLDARNPQWQQLMRQQYQKKYADEAAQDYAQKAKRAKYLQTRGFPLEWVFKLDSIEEFE